MFAVASLEDCFLGQDGQKWSEEAVWYTGLCPLGGKGYWDEWYDFCSCTNCRIDVEGKRTL